jgi:enoyl-CoA hydratase/carnithine racemase
MPTLDQLSVPGVLQVTCDDDVVRLQLDRPERLNALNDELRIAIVAVLRELEERPDLRVVVLSGAGRSFSAGADLTSTAYAPIDPDWSTARHQTGTWQRLLDQFESIPQVTVGRLHGNVVGGAGLLAAACDIRVAAQSTVLSIPELLIGIPLTWAGLPRLAREVGLPLARDWVMTGRRVNSDELLRSGFTQRLVADDQLDAAVQECVDQLLTAGAAALAMTRSLSASLSRHHPGMAAGWGDSDHMRWSMTEEEYRRVASGYVRRRLGKST